MITLVAIHVPLRDQSLKSSRVDWSSVTTRLDGVDSVEEEGPKRLAALLVETEVATQVAATALVQHQKGWRSINLKLDQNRTAGPLPSAGKSASDNIPSPQLPLQPHITQLIITHRTC